MVRLGDDSERLPLDDSLCRYHSHCSFRCYLDVFLALAGVDMVIQERLVVENANNRQRWVEECLHEAMMTKTSCNEEGTALRDLSAVGTHCSGHLRCTQNAEEAEYYYYY